MQLPYGFIINPCYFIVFEYRSYHSSADYMNPYRYFIRRRYSYFIPLSTRTFFLRLGFTSRMMSIKLLLIFYRINVSSGFVSVEVWPRDIKKSTSLPSCALMMRMSNKASREMVNEGSSSLVMQHLWVCPSVYVLSFNFMIRFSFISFICLNDTFFCDLLRLLGSSAPTTLMYSSCVY